MICYVPDSRFWLRCLAVRIRWGGADSVALVHVLRALGYPVRTYHLNHCLRGEESERDADFVHSLCIKLDVPLTLEREDAAAYAAQTGESVETAARKLRYARLSGCAARQGITRIATAHTADDNLETMLFHLARGTGTRGMAGIPPYARLSGCAARQGITRIATAHTADDNLETMLFHLARGTGTRGMAGIPPVRGAIVRPLWTATRAEIEAYLSGLGQDFVVDSSNLSLDYTRNRIRHTVVPALRTVNPGCTGAATRLAEQLRRDDDALCILAERALGQESPSEGIALCAFDQLPAIQSRMLTALLRRAGVPMQQVSERHIGLMTGLLAPVGRHCTCRL